MSEVSAKNKKLVIGFIFFAVITLLVAIIFVVFSNRTVSNISVEYGTNVHVVLDCITDIQVGGFFYSDKAKSVENHVKILFKDDKVDKLFYSFEGAYDSHETAEREKTDHHIKYDRSFKELKFDPESLTPNFSVVDTRMYINLYTDDVDIVKGEIGELFFINNSSVLGLPLDQVENYYEKKGFTCEKYD